MTSKSITWNELITALRNVKDCNICITTTPHNRVGSHCVMYFAPSDIRVDARNNDIYFRSKFCNSINLPMMDVVDYCKHDLVTYDICYDHETVSITIED